MTETAASILAKDVDGGVEEVVLDLLARIEALQAQIATIDLAPAVRRPVRYIAEYDDGSRDTFDLVPT